MFLENFNYSNTIADRNEDATHSDSQYLFVLDGATGLFGQTVTPCQSDAQWLSHNFKAYLTTHLSLMDKSLADIVSVGIKNVKSDFEVYKKVEKSEDYPSCSCSIVRINGDFLEYLSMADSPILVQKIDGTVTVIAEERLQVLDKISLCQAVEISKTDNISVKDAIPKIAETLKKHRNLLNSKDGYHAISIDSNAPYGAVLGSLPLAEIHAVAICSDGFSQHFDTLNISKNAEDFFNILLSKPAEEIFLDIVHKQKSDPTFDKYPRFKLSDDASVALGILAK